MSKLPQRSHLKRLARTQARCGCDSMFTPLVIQLRPLGLHGYAMDFIRAEAPIKAYLRSARVHETASRLTRCSQEFAVDHVLSSRPYQADLPTSKRQ